MTHETKTGKTSGRRWQLFFIFPQSRCTQVFSAPTLSLPFSEGFHMVWRASCRLARIVFFIYPIRFVVESKYLLSVFSILSVHL